MAHASATTLVHGLSVTGEIAVPAAPPAGRGGKADLTTNVATPAAVPLGPPPGQPVAALGGSSGYAACLRDHQLTIRFFGVAEFEIDLAAGTARAIAEPGREAMVELLFSGNVLSIVLGLRGYPVLHASTIRVAGSALAIAGPSGAGKSTVTALMCENGADLIGEDTARLGQIAGAPAVFRGVQELRLRPSAQPLAARMLAPARASADSRTTFDLTSEMPPLVALDAVVLPGWSSEQGPVDATRLGGAAALRSLLACPRVGGWIAAEPLRANFDAFTELARRIPCFALRLPRGRLDDPNLGSEIERALDLAGAPIQAGGA